MTYNTIFARSFSKHDQKKLGYSAFVGCFIIALSICTVFKPDLYIIPALNLKVFIGTGLKNMLMTEEMSKSDQNVINIQVEELKLIPNISETKPTDIRAEEFKQKPSIVQTEKFEQKPNISILSSADETTLELKTIPDIAKPIQKGDPIEKINQFYNISYPKSVNVQTQEPNPIKTIPNSRSSSIQTRISQETPSIFKTNPITIQKEITKPICNNSMPRTNVCEMRGDIRIDAKSSTVYFALPNAALLPEKSEWTIKPYARKEDKAAMEGVREFKVKMVNSVQENVPQCTRNHSVIGIVFSTSGYIGNHFHDFTDTIIPLYITSREFHGEVKFVVTNKNPWWINKYRAIFQKLSNYEVIDIDKENEVHCFPNMIVGLKQHKEFNIDPSRSKYSMRDFRKFLRETYSLKRQKAIKLSQRRKARVPRLLIISRKKSRAFLNEGEITNMARNMGFEVVVAEADSNESRFAKIVNSCDVMMGVHGAGLTNILFLPEKAVFVQILALGNMEWLARTYFGEPSKDMNLRYLEYRISENESSLIQQYPLDHPVIRDPNSISRSGWLAYREIYLVKQNVKLDVDRFRGTLQEALKLLKL